MNRTRTVFCIEAATCAFPLAALMVITLPEFLGATAAFVLRGGDPAKAVDGILAGLAVYAFAALAFCVVARPVIATLDGKSFQFTARYWAEAVAEVLLGVALFWVLSPLAAAITVLPLLALSVHAAVIQLREIHPGMAPRHT